MSGLAKASAVALLVAVSAPAPASAQSNFVFAPDPALQAAPQEPPPINMPARLRYAPDEGQYAANPEAVQGFTSPDKWIIPRYFELRRDKQIRARASRSMMPRDLPNGLSEPPKKGDLLPAFELNELPAPLLRDLPRLPQGLVRAVVGHDVILLRQRNNEVVDVLEKVIR
ncbi:hypothetical protein [Ferrovibrio sp.]|uniref:hypothetical protein n=1 Tax=Ferrovibrio sp. TaxID=1917215 RepID=UPI0025B852DD|nr:hypothetical protein [Ferrovibrio sp.]MBX3453903.1 hypothetical protein [Ferrovibrio sp.]